jgi:hypothetical protein
MDISRYAKICYWKRYDDNACPGVSAGTPSSCEDLARKHNGGPCGQTNPNTLEYWKNVKKKMKETCGLAPEVMAQCLGGADSGNNEPEDVILPYGSRGGTGSSGGG